MNPLLFSSHSAFFYPSALATSFSSDPNYRKIGKDSAVSSFISSYRKYINPSPTFVERVLPNAELIRNNSFNFLFTFDPSLDDLALHRSRGSAFNFSLVGITHTLSTPSALSSISRLTSNHIYPWDCLVCTSSSALSAVNNVLDNADASFYSRGLKPPPRLHLPVIPLGIDLDKFISCSTKSDSRAHLGIPPQAFVALWVGRLELHCKSHHASAFRVLQKLATSLSSTLR